MHTFEVFIRGDRVEAKDWHELVRWLSGRAENFEIEVEFGNGNGLEIWVRTEATLQAGTQGLFVLKPEVKYGV
ncbi:MAG: hypothetical protein UX80_C0010G0008 [Candidatus Amesbacteria bacterium GW2011_GWA2_47_11b]|uniref:Uncharacterized protein n=2 Tax=Candidatus Amesiibacteriota TaxID=1752730 RepID=A0A0G1RKY0_9BACT|nr:MAG: hypothetical protein UX42_C0007G0033 [Microgenomates group bacterium GW2011_GWC1_46_20]KKU57747.1 MAG: hypothetical protein UX80_C0010G0008 [Candidatus Amesbacteria bacterium GW2011_GWA2_47_11b]KKU83050.1 MAG: hypothetical protein UY11_C0030G0005 [Candidatus Amesbacteria bacterium GW2011_GWC2_47_8]